MINLNLSRKQKKAVNDFYFKSDKCSLCLEPLPAGEKRALLTQPNSLRAEIPGILKVACFCMSCFEKLNAVFKEIKLNRKKS